LRSGYRNLLQGTPLNYKPSDKSEDCSLQWFEKTDVPYTEATKKNGKNVWNDMTKDPEVIWSFKWWNKKGKQCPGLLPLHDEDRPSTGINQRCPGRSSSGFLVNSSPSCPCKKPYVGFHAVQTLDPTQDPWVWDFKLISRF
jgi:hypothetical protein